MRNERVWDEARLTLHLLSDLGALPPLVRLNLRAFLVMDDPVAVHLHAEREQAF